MNIDEMMFTKYILTILKRNDYYLIEGSRQGREMHLNALKRGEDCEDDLELCNYDDTFLVDFLADNAFFQEKFGEGQEKFGEGIVGRKIDDLLEECNEYYNEQEDKDSDFDKFIKVEIENIVALFKRKSKAYGTVNDVFYNFRNTAKRMHGDDTFDNMFLIAETYKDKHNVVLSKGITAPEAKERLRNIILYSILQLAMIKKKDCEE